jgi:hypothetical protein
MRFTVIHHSLGLSGLSQGRGADPSGTGGRARCSGGNAARCGRALLSQSIQAFVPPLRSAFVRAAPWFSERNGIIEIAIPTVAIALDAARHCRTLSHSFSKSRHPPDGRLSRLPRLSSSPDATAPGPSRRVPARARAARPVLRLAERRRSFKNNCFQKGENLTAPLLSDEGN